MIEFGGWYFPAGETHLPEWLKTAGKLIDDRLAYQHKKWQATLGYVANFAVAVDVGAHVGLWSYYLAKRFGTVHAFEPVQEHRECFALNVDALNVIVHPCALGEAEGLVSIRTEPTSSGDSRVDGVGTITMSTLDSFGLKNVGLIKVDTEGYELFVLRGGEHTIRACRPVIVVEQKRGHAQMFGLPEIGAVYWLQSLGYRVADEMAGDFIMVPERTTD